MWLNYYESQMYQIPSAVLVEGNVLVELITPSAMISLPRT